MSEKRRDAAGLRIIPMSDGVYDCFERIINVRCKPKKEPVVDGYEVRKIRNGSPQISCKDMISQKNLQEVTVKIRGES